MIELRVKELLREQGTLFKDLAQKIGVTDVGLRQALKGNPTIGTLEKIASALNVEVWELFTRSTDKGDFIAIIKNGNKFYSATSFAELKDLINNIEINA